jgi:hypothetical protein
LRARVEDPQEMRMGSPQYGSLVLDGEKISRPGSVEARSLLWSDDGRRLAVQQLVAWPDGPRTRVVVFDTERRTEIAASPSRDGIVNPLRFEPGVLVYRHWHHRTGEQVMRLTLRCDHGS